MYVLLQNPCAPLSLNGTFIDVMITHDATGSNTPQKIKGPYLNFVLKTLWMVLFWPLSPSPQEKKNEIWTWQTMAHLFQKSQPNLWILLICGFYFAWLNVCEALTMSTNNGFPKCSLAQVIMSITAWCWFLMQCCLKHQRSQAVTVVFPPRPLHAKVSPPQNNVEPFEH